MITKTVSRFNDFEEQYMCLSSDDKPTEGVAENALLLELDTGDFYYFANDGWSVVGESPIADEPEPDE